MLIEHDDLVVQMITWNALGIEPGHQAISMSLVHFQASDLHCLIKHWKKDVHPNF